MPDDYNINVTEGQITSIGGADAGHFSTRQNDTVFNSDKDFTPAKITKIWPQIVIRPDFQSMNFESGNEYIFEDWDVGDGIDCFDIAYYDARLNVINNECTAESWMDYYCTPIPGGFKCINSFTGSLSCTITISQPIFMEFKILSNVRCYVNMNYTTNVLYEVQCEGNSIDIFNGNGVNSTILIGSDFTFNSGGYWINKYFLLTSDVYAVEKIDFYWAMRNTLDLNVGDNQMALPHFLYQTLDDPCSLIVSPANTEMYSGEILKRGATFSGSILNNEGVNVFINLGNGYFIWKEFFIINVYEDESYCQLISQSFDETIESFSYDYAWVDIPMDPDLFEAHGYPLAVMRTVDQYPPTSNACYLLRDETKTNPVCRLTFYGTSNPNVKGELIWLVTP